MGCAITMGVPQVSGMKPIFTSFFSMGPMASSAMALAASRGKMLLITAMADDAPSIFMNERRLTSLPPNILRTTEDSTARSMADSPSTGDEGDTAA